jgi:hypothetical protein
VKTFSLTDDSAIHVLHLFDHDEVLFAIKALDVISYLQVRNAAD